MLRDPVEARGEREFRALLSRREIGEPLSYLTGTREFWGLDFLVSPSVLIPRPESELLVEEACRLVPEHTKRVSFADLGTGSGCLAIAIVSELTKRGIDVTCTAVDQSRDALSIAEENARRHGVGDRIRFVESDWFSNGEMFSPPYDFIVANPPYVDRSERLPVELSFEPSSALFSEERGLADSRQILLSAQQFLVPRGVVLCEIGAGKREMLKEWFAGLAVGATLELLGDDSPDDRFTVLKVVQV
jgi:release factor glutamine methyltransferase